LDKLEGFASLNGPAFYRLPVNAAKMTLQKSDAATQFPEKIDTDNGPVTVFDPGYPIHWSVAR
ncbi:MAG: dihydroorotase, partial [Shimia sp.]